MTKPWEVKRWRWGSRKYDYEYSWNNKFVLDSCSLLFSAFHRANGYFREYELMNGQRIIVRPKKK